MTYTPHCRHGHPLTGDNLGVRADGRSYCVPCDNERCRKRREAGPKRPYGKRNPKPTPPKYHDGGMGRCSEACPACARERAEIKRAEKERGHVLELGREKRRSMPEKGPGSGSGGLSPPDTDSGSIRDEVPPCTASAGQNGKRP